MKLLSSPSDVLISELVNMSEDDLEDELRIRNPTQRQLLVQTAQALLKCEAKRRFFGQPVRS